nr:DUF389 domain-containing protein [Chromobacterium sp. ASV5]
MIAARFSLRTDQAGGDVIDANLRAGVELSGTYLWTLICAIFIASVGLNVNSTAVIIGAMLISPLMGPIMGIGYGVGIYDFELIKKSFKNLGIAALVSLLTSSLYFWVSPLAEAQSELLARTSPTIWDVMIAMFGGLAGIIGATRKDKSNVIPGVAIATALMPPLCTAGYSLAHGNLHYFLGAIYLFSINCVFIALSTTLITWFVKPGYARQVDSETQAKVRRYVLAVAVITILPSLFLAYQLVQAEIFNSKARSFVKRELVFDKAVVADAAILPDSRTIAVTVVGAVQGKSALDALNHKLSDYGLADAKLLVQQAGSEQIDVKSLKEGIFNDLKQASQKNAEAKDRLIASLQERLQEAEAPPQAADLNQDIAAELHAQYPQIHKTAMGEANVWREDGSSGKVTLLVVSSAHPLSRGERQRIGNWLRARLKSDAVELVSRVEPRPAAHPTSQ